MADVFTKAKRSEVMSRIRSRGNKATEVKLAALLRKHKITGWRRQQKLIVRKLMVDSRTRRGKDHQLAVRPDFVFPKHRLAVFVDGCFWHGCPKHGTQPKGNRAFWKNKFARNIARDRLVTKTLRKSGWRVLRIWEHELAKKREGRLLTRLHTILG